MKKFLIHTVNLAFALGIGIGFAHIINKVWGDAPGGFMELLKALLVAFGSLMTGFFVNVTLHETGHLAGGLFTGYKFLSFRILNLTLQKEEDGFHWKKFGLIGTLGQCLMIPPDKDPVPYFWCNAGGVLANLIIVAISAVMLLSLELTTIPFSVLLMLLLTGARFSFMNGVPMSPGGVPNDGMNILTLWRNPEQKRCYRDMLVVSAEQSLGRRLGEMPEEWFVSNPLDKDSTVMEMSVRNLQYSRLLDELRFEEALPMAEELHSLGESLPVFFQMEVACDRVLMELALWVRERHDQAASSECAESKGDVEECSERLAIVDELWNREFGNARMTLHKYVTTYSEYLPLKCAVLFAYELVVNKSPGSAGRYYDEVKSKQNTYAQPGEARTALAIMDYLKAD